MWRTVIEQKTVLVCFKEGLNEIVGISMNYVTCKDDHFYESICRQNKSENNNRMYDVFRVLFDNFDIYEHYGVDYYMNGAGLAVAQKYRGRGIGLEFLKTRKSFCNMFRIELTSTIFTSSFSNNIADKAGFKLDKINSYEEIRIKHPHLKLPHINSDALTLKSMKF
ncbi:uncharacterized protein LOC116349302 [Contarinia nasturtii]|uniref:uncharacterized protein LOC116349302 n=1 Tax=Contarinia nasturtii TaxID=265458 RepID=UPI0012D432E5|nr:uncharacterized protein LOC116349302 [Contarinia nasturtii]XP_031636533.1 uncharacterized protein LOC116349302 [Contarinia nasturtii]XP_031636534.1 uncharacterized protein LOC116349302 [Contarinia nasturtii]